MRDVEVGAIYKHFKGHKVKVLAIARDTENTDSYAVIYEHLGDREIWYRPYDMFISEVDHEKYPEVTQRYRFEKVKEPMSKEDHLKEMAKVICLHYGGGCADCPIAVYPPCNAKAQAEKFYNAGYRKQSEVTRAILKDIEKAAFVIHDDDSGEFIFCMSCEDFRELRKKYTEGE